MADLAKIKAVTRTWAPRVVAVTAGTAIGVLLTTFGVRALAELSASKGDLIIMVSGVLAVISVNVAVWLMWGREKVADLRQARIEAASWHREACEYREHVAALQQQVARLDAARVTPGEVVSLLTKRMGETP